MESIHIGMTHDDPNKKQPFFLLGSHNKKAPCHVASREYHDVSCDLNYLTFWLESFPVFDWWVMSQVGDVDAIWWSACDDDDTTY